jgi:hypothetical protein
LPTSGLTLPLMSYEWSGEDNPTVPRRRACIDHENVRMMRAANCWSISGWQNRGDIFPARQRGFARCIGAHWLAKAAKQKATCAAKRSRARLDDDFWRQWWLPTPPAAAPAQHFRQSAAIGHSPRQPDMCKISNSSAIISVLSLGRYMLASCHPRIYRFVKNCRFNLCFTAFPLVLKTMVGNFWLPCRNRS